MKISGKNIRATALEDFWSDSYSESVYLWEGAKHNLSLSDIMQHDVPTLHDLFATQSEIQQGHDFCKSFYYRVLPVLAGKLNEVHGVDLPVSFWKTSFGYWLYRHIAIVYEKYCYLSLINVDQTGIKLLDKRDFYVPQDHYHHIFCFACDFGVQQLVSHYYYLFKTKEFEVVRKQFCYNYQDQDNDALAETFRRHYAESGKEPSVALLGVCFTQEVSNRLFQSSDGLVDIFLLPATSNRTYEPDFVKRSRISSFTTDDKFEYYFFQTLYYCLPKALLENFADYYSVFRNDVADRKFTHIVSECWISNIRMSLYLAVAQENNRKFISYEHGSGEYYYKNSVAFIDHDAADMYLSVGSQRPGDKFVQGGFACRDIAPYVFDSEKRAIVFVGRTKFPYWYEFNEWSPVNSTFIKELKQNYDLIDLLPPDLKQYLVYRPRIEEYFWDTEHSLELRQKGVYVDRGEFLDFSASISRARIILIDHISTGIAEILLMNAPFLLVHDIRAIPLSDEMSEVFSELISCGVIHISAQSAVSHLSSIYANVEAWWKSSQVQGAVARLVSMTLAPPSITMDFLLSLVEKCSNEVRINEFLQDNYGVYVSSAAKDDFGYSDGAEHEDFILAALASTRDVSLYSEELRSMIKDWPSEYHFSMERHNLLRHVIIRPEMSILELGCGCGAITRQLGESGAKVTAVEGSLRRARSAAARCRDLENVKVYCSNFQDVEFTEKYDLVTLIGVLEYSPQYFKSEDPVKECLEIASRALKADGVLVIAIENQLGLKYFCGLREDHADIPYFGIEDRYTSGTAVTFGQQELDKKLRDIGFSKVEFQYPFPDYKVPKAVFTDKAFEDDNFYPSEIIRQLTSRDYSGQLEPAFDEKLTVPLLCKNGIMKDLSNSFLVFSSKSKNGTERLWDARLLAVVYTTDRANAFNVKTSFLEFQDDIIVRKRRLFPGKTPVSHRDVLQHVLMDEKYLTGRNLEAEYRKFIKTGNFEGVSHLLTLQFAFLVSEAVTSPDQADISRSLIKPGYFDCIPSNLILKDNRIYYIDREWNLNREMSLGALLLRSVDALHEIDPGRPELERENLIRILKQAGFEISNETKEEYDCLIRDVMLQVYQGANLDSEIFQKDDQPRLEVEGLLARMKYLPKAAETVERLSRLVERVLQLYGGQADCTGKDYICDPETADQDDLDLLNALYSMIKGKPEWDCASDMIAGTLEKACSKPVTGDYLSLHDLSANPIESFRRFSYGKEFKDYICPNPFIYAETGQNGEVGCCCYLPFSLGNLNDGGIREIWNSSAALELRRSMLSGQFSYCDKSKCSAMQEAGLPQNGSFSYQVPYRLMKRSQPDNSSIMREVLAHDLFKLEMGPSVVSLEDDCSCNLSCPSCRRGVVVLPQPQSRKLSTRQWSLLEELGSELKELWLCGAGDPFASYSYRRLLTEYDFNRNPQLLIRIDTNGTLLNEDVWDGLPANVKKRIKLVAVSVDAATSETYEQIRRGGSFERLIDNLRFISGLSERKRGMGFIIRMIVQRKNFREMKNFVMLGKSLGVDAVVFSVLQNWGTFDSESYTGQAVHLSLNPDHQELRKILEDPVFSDPLVNMGNLVQLYRVVNTGKTAAVCIGAGSDIPVVAPEFFPKRARVIAFYLPQFHPIPENDMWWGKGFTEWTNVGKAKPLFEGHYQPHVPADLGYYDLRVPETRQVQADLARQYGIEAFCYWHYWFAGHRLLERPFEEVVRSGQPDFPFCLGWANQTWSGIWHGAPDRVLVEQTYPGIEDYKAHFEALLPAFRDPRYLRVDGKALFVIYSPSNLPDALLFTSYWQELAADNGLDGFYFVAHLENHYEAFGCQACLDGAPFATMNAPLLEMKPLTEKGLPLIHHYSDLVSYLKDYKLADREYPLVFPNWDNTPRSGVNGLVLHGSTPELFKEMMEDAICKVERNYKPEERFVFIKAWNEWAEGNHLEPDLQYGHGYLQVLRESLATEAVNSHVPNSVLSGTTLPDQRINVPRPWTAEYFSYRAQFNEKVLEDAGIINLFALGFQLPDYFAVGLDERSVEYPWFLASAGKSAQKILDAGSALNHPEILKQRYWENKELTIVTLAPEANQYEIEWLRYVYSDLRKLPFEDNYFDEIVCISTLEHVGMDNTKFLNRPDYKEQKNSDYLTALLEMHRVLKPGGRLLLTVPFGKQINYVDFQQFDKKMLDTCAAFFSGTKRCERYYHYTPTGWKLAGSVEQCCNLEYSSYAVKSSWGGQPASCSPDPDGAAAARAVACCIWEKHLNV